MKLLQPKCYGKYHEISCVNECGSKELCIKYSEAIAKMKDKTKKLRMDLIEPNFITELAKVMSYGAEKYAPNSWRDIENPMDSYYAACMRHLMSYRSGEKTDSESGINHLSHAAINIMFMLYAENKTFLCKICKKNYTDSADEVCVSCRDFLMYSRIESRTDDKKDTCWKIQKCNGCGKIKDTFSDTGLCSECYDKATSSQPVIDG